MIDLSLVNIKAVLRSEDIEGFIHLGAPSDEYDSEAKKIADALSTLADNQLTSDNIVAVVALVWAKSFNRSADEIERRMSAFRHIAQQLL